MELTCNRCGSEEFNVEVILDEDDKKHIHVTCSECQTVALDNVLI